MQAKILVIDDEEPICEILRFNLEKEGYEVDCAFSAEEALTMDLNPYDLFIVDIMMDKLTGFDFARKIKKIPALENKPLIFCSALNGEDEIVKGLNIGSDDYITKPFQVAPMMAKIRALLRRTTQQTHIQRPSLQMSVPQTSTHTIDPTTIPQKHEPDVVFHGLRINRDEKTCTLNGQPLKLTKTEYEILLFFLNHMNKIYSREEILHHVWGDKSNVTTRSVDTNITRLRTKLGDYKSNIVTRTGFGYGFQEEL